MPLFSKYSGAGNDFVIVRAEEIGLGDAGALARRVCSRRWGVGVDGLILVRELGEHIVRIRFFNPDGSEFGTCGNGSRCAARYAADRVLVGPELLLVTDDGEVRARINGSDVVLDYALDPETVRPLQLDVAGARSRGWQIQMGTPHLVVEVEDIELDDFEGTCRALRHHPDLGPEGANVDLVQMDRAGVRVRTYERGVEGETLACGSGCMATAFALIETGRAEGEVRIETRSGDSLRVEFREEGLIRLGGPAHHVFDGVLPDDSAGGA